MIDDDDAVTHRLDLRQDVGGENDRVILAQALDEGADLNHLLGVETDRRLVQDQHRRIADECLCQADTLLVALGKVLDETVLYVLDLAQRHDVLHMGTARELAFFQVKDEIEIALDGHVQIQRRDLREIADVGLGLDGILENVHAVDERLSGRRGNVAGEHVHGRGLAGAVRAEKSEDLPVLHGKADVVHGFFVTVMLCQISDFDHGSRNLLIRIRHSKPGAVQSPV